MFTHVEVYPTCSDLSHFGYKPVKHFMRQDGRYGVTGFAKKELLICQGQFKAREIGPFKNEQLVAS